MTPTWYDTPEKIAALEAAARGWLGTPFRANSHFKGAGGGVSCHNLAAELYFETGYMVRFPVPAGTVRTLALGIGPALLDRFPKEIAARFQIVTEPLPGDMLVLREGRIVKHLGVMLGGGLFVHVLRWGTHLSALSDSTYGSNLEEIRRPTP